MSKQTTDNDYGELEENTLSNKSEVKRSSTKGVPKMTASSGYGKTNNFELIDNETMTRFTEIIKKFEDSDWKKRVAALKGLSNFILEEEKLISKSKKFFGIVDVLVQ